MEELFPYRNYEPNPLKVLDLCSAGALQLDPNVHLRKPSGTLLSERARGAVHPGVTGSGGWKPQCLCWDISRAGPAGGLEFSETRLEEAERANTGDKQLKTIIIPVAAARGKYHSLVVPGSKCA